MVAARPGLGTISHTLLTVEAARSAALDVRGIVKTPWPAYPTGMERSNRETVARLSGVEVSCLGEVTPAELPAAGASLPLEAWFSVRPTGVGDISGDMRG